MLVFGTNLTVLCRELSITIEGLGVYKYTKNSGLTLYEVRDPNSILNLAPDLFDQYNAFILLPGEWLFPYSKMVQIKIRGSTIVIPDDVVTGASRKNKYSDIFSYAALVPPRAVDFVYTAARLNKFSLSDFLDKYAVDW